MGCCREWAGGQEILNPTRSGPRHADAEGRAQINLVLLLLHDDGAQDFTERKFPHRLGLADAVAVTPHRDPFVFQVRAEHGHRVV